MWSAAAHSDEENTRWAWLRAVEWLGWPEFITQPLVPILFYLFDWPSVVCFVLVAGFLWRLLVVPSWVSIRLADAGPVVVLLKFVTAPAMAYLIWKRGQIVLAIGSLLWPLYGPFLIQLVANVLVAIVSAFRPGLSEVLGVGVIQTRFLQKVGFKPAHDSLMDEAIQAAYGGKVPKQAADLSLAVALAANELLGGAVEQEQLMPLAQKLHNGPVPYSTYDLATSLALSAYKNAPVEDRQRLFYLQLNARLKVAEWLKEGKVTPLLVQAFEHTLYQLYKPSSGAP